MEGLRRIGKAGKEPTRLHKLTRLAFCIVVTVLFVLVMSPLGGFAIAEEDGASDTTSETELETRAVRPPTPELGWTDSHVGYVSLSWGLALEDDDEGFDGVGTVDHFNIYRDHRLVDQIDRGAVDVDVYWWDNQYNYSYGWYLNTPVPDAGVDYEWYVTAVSPDGTEGDPSESRWAGGTPSGTFISDHKAWYDNSYLNEETNEEKPCVLIRVDANEAYFSINWLEVWRAEGTNAPDTSGEPYMRAPKNRAISGITQHDIEDYNVVGGKTYTYTIRGLTADGIQTKPYTFTMKALPTSGGHTIYFGQPEVTYKTQNGTTATLEINSFYWGNDSYPAVYKAYRNNKLIKTVRSVADRTVTDKPTTDGMYVYRVDQEVAGVVTKGHEFTFRRNTTPVDPSTFGKAPGAPELTGRVAATDSSRQRGIAMLDWTPSDTGGEPEGFYIYRKDAGSFVEGTFYPPNSYGPRLWGLNRYLKIPDASVHSFVDKGGAYNNDRKQGDLTNLLWDDQSAPHEYYVTAYNQYGESAPSNVITFPYDGGTVPGNADATAPGAPTIRDVWIEWNDHSGYDSNMESGTFDENLHGTIRVAFDEPADGANVESYQVKFESNSQDDEPHDYNGDGMIDDVSWSTEDLPRWAFAYYPLLLDGIEVEGAGGYLPEHGVSYYDYGSTFTVTVIAKNGAGETTSQPAQVSVHSIPMIQVRGGNAHAFARWSDLYHDETTTVTDWELYRTAEHGLPELVGSFAPDVHEYDDTTARNGWTYTYYVVAKCTDGIDRRSVGFQTSVSHTKEVPAAPTDLAANWINGEMILSWTQPNTGGTPREYKCDIVPAEEEWPPESEGHSWLVDGASTGARLELRHDWYGRDLKMRIYAVNDDGCSAASNEITLRLTDEDEEQRATSVPDFVWINGTAGDGFCKLTWDASTDSKYPPATYYVLTRSVSGEYDVQFVIPAKGTGAQSYEYVDRTVENGITYKYVVRAWNAAGEAFNWDFNYELLRPYGRSHDLEVAEDVAALIDALPAPEDVTLDDADSIEAVQRIWEGLSYSQRQIVGPELEQKLADDVQALEDLQSAELYNELVAPVQALIDALPDAADVTPSHEAQVSEARAAYDALSPAAAKRLVKRVSRLTEAEAALQGYRDQAAADVVVALIDALPDPDAVTLDDQPEVAAARAALDALTDAQWTYVPEASITRLTDIERAIRNLGHHEPDTDRAWTRLAGADRYDTMAAIVEQSYTSSEWAVVATGVNFPDALAASALAGAYDAPVVLTTKDSLSQQASTQLQRLGVKHVFIMGGEAAISSATASQIEGLNGGIEVIRVAGEDRLETSVEAMRLVSGRSDTVIIATGYNFADTLSIGPWSYLTGSPIVLTQRDGTLSESEVSAIHDAGYSQYIIVGGTKAVSNEVYDQLSDLDRVMRLAGEDRYETSEKIARFELSWGMEAAYPVVATGANFPDALAGVAVCCVNNSVMVLVLNDSSAGISVLEDKAADIVHGYILGGEVAVPSSLASVIAARTDMAFAG